GLMRFFKRNTSEQYHEQVQRETEESRELFNEQKGRQGICEAEKSEKARASNRERQQRHWAGLYREQIETGDRSPGGTKRKRTIVELEDSRPKRAKASIAELSRPDRAHNESLRKKNKPQGRKQKHLKKDAKYHNWFSPFLWSQIEAGAKHISVGKSMSTYYLVKVMQQKDPITFGGLSRSTIEGWIDRSGKIPRWNDATLARIERGNHQGFDHGGRKGVLAKYPAVVEMIKSRLVVLRDASSPITLVTARGIIVATILDMAPEVFKKVAKDGSLFRCSDSYLRRWLHETMRWAQRKATHAAQKLPINWEDICEKSFL
ncbi:hypothetical protein V8E52_010957, partial [Russula decolorans]